MWAPNQPKLFELWFILINLGRAWYYGGDGEACDGCFLWFPYSKLERRRDRQGRYHPQCLECEAFVSEILEGLDA